MNDNADARTANPLWDFSLQIYASGEVQQACIELQDGCGVDVNVMLLLLFLAASGCRLTAADVTRIVEAVEPWRADVVVPLRTARRNLKQPAAAVDTKGAEALRNMVKKLELEAERLQQDALDRGWGPRHWPKGSIPALAAEANLRSYGEALGRTLAPAPVKVMLDALGRIVAGGAPVR